MPKSIKSLFVILFGLFSVCAYAMNEAVLIDANATLGCALLLLGIAFVVAEIYLFTFGFLAMSGLVAFIVGSILIIDANTPGFGISWLGLLGVGLAMLVFAALAVTLAIRAYRKKVITGVDGLIGSEGEVLSTDAGIITVRVAGEIWQAKSHLPLHPKQKIRVTHVSGLELAVKPIDKN